MSTPATASNNQLYRITASLILIIALGYLLKISGEILAPLAFSLLIAMLLLPLCRRLERWRVPRALAILICILVVVVLLSSLVWFFTSQAMSFQDQIPVIQKRGTQLLGEMQAWVEAKFRIQSSVQLAYLRQAGNQMLGEGGAIFSGLTGFTTSFVTVLGLMPIYIFFILYYRNFLMAFVVRLFSKEENSHVHKVAARIEDVSQSYLLGLLTVIVILAVMNTIGLLLLGIQNAVFFAVLASILCVIPYIGIAIGATLPALIALVTKDSAWYAVGVMGFMVTVQFLESNFITPNIVGGRVSVNPFAAVIALLTAGAMWGPAGMVLAIPFTAILKVIFDNVAGLKPWGFIIGEPLKDVPLGKKSPVGKALDKAKRETGTPDSEEERPKRGNSAEVK